LKRSESHTFRKREMQGMCGIVGYVGKREAGPILMEGLHRLEYRGYDSAGIACARNNKLSIHKAKGKVRELERQLPAQLKGTPGIAHTRWATHGEPSDRNAHPHSDGTGRFAIVISMRTVTCRGVNLGSAYLIYRSGMILLWGF